MLDQVFEVGITESPLEIQDCANGTRKTCSEELLDKYYRRIQMNKSKYSRILISGVSPDLHKIMHFSQMSLAKIIAYKLSSGPRCLAC